MGKLHELLATEASRESVATKLINETIQTLKNKESLFKGKIRTLIMFGINDENRIEMEAIQAKNSSNTKVSATIPDTLNYLASEVTAYYDVILQKECTNQLAKADLIVDGVVIGKDLPATFLLGMETKLKTLRSVLEEIPTMAPGVIWHEAAEIGPYIRKTDQVKDVKTEKVTDHKMLPQPNPNIPVQYVPIEGLRNTGEYTETQFTGLITSADKARLLKRLDNVIMEVKMARQRANNVDAVNSKIGQGIFGYILGNWHRPDNVNPHATV